MGERNLIDLEISIEGLERRPGKGEGRRGRGKERNEKRQTGLRLTREALRCQVLLY